jgi:hypothetical protein
VGAGIALRGLAAIFNFVNISAVNAMLSAKVFRVCSSAFHVYCPVRVTVGAADLHLMLLHIYEFRENRPKA